MRTKMAVVPKHMTNFPAKVLLPISAYALIGGEVVGVSPTFFITAKDRRL